MSPSLHTAPPHLPLGSLPVSQRARLVAVTARGAIRQRLFDMGLLPGCELEVLRVAPAQGPVWVRLEASQLSLRRGEANELLVERLP